MLTLSVKGVFGATLVGASTISREASFAAEATSPNSVETQRSPFWKPSCAGSLLSMQVSVRIFCPLTTLPAPLSLAAFVCGVSSACDSCANPIAPPAATTTAPTASRRPRFDPAVARPERR